MSEHRTPEAATGPDEEQGTQLRLVSGRLSDAELAAIAVAVSTMSVTSRIQAVEHALAAELHTESDGWCDAVHSIEAGHALRGLASDSAWMFSHR